MDEQFLQHALVAGLVVTLFEAKLTPRALGGTAAVGAAGIRRSRGRAPASRPIRVGSRRVRGTWAMVASNGVVWLVYGVLVGHPLLGAAGLLQLPCSMIVIARPLRDRGDAEVDAGAETLGPASDGP